jgi:hypothetical protein
MRYLVLMLRIFVTAFGLTEPKPHQEKKAALFFAGTITILVLLLAAAVWLILQFALRR